MDVTKDLSKQLKKIKKNALRVETKDKAPRSGSRPYIAYMNRKEYRKKGKIFIYDLPDSLQRYVLDADRELAPNTASYPGSIHKRGGFSPKAIISADKLTLRNLQKWVIAEEVGKIFDVILPQDYMKACIHTQKLRQEKETKKQLIQDIYYIAKLLGVTAKKVENQIRFPGIELHTTVSSYPSLTNIELRTIVSPMGEKQNLAVYQMNGKNYYAMVKDGQGLFTVFFDLDDGYNKPLRDLVPDIVLQSTSDGWKRQGEWYFHRVLFGLEALVETTNKELDNGRHTVEGKIFAQNKGPEFIQPGTYVTGIVKSPDHDDLDLSNGIYFACRKYQD
jgi:hypothetical protein